MNLDKGRRILFHLEKDILPIGEMQSCISEFFEFVQTASADCLSDLKWYAEIEHGSVALATYPSSDTESDEEIDQCLDAIRNDLKLIKGGKQPEMFGQKTMQHYSNMTKPFLVDGHLSGNPTIVINSPDSKDQAPIAMVGYQTPSVPYRLTHSFGTAYGEVKSLFATSGKPFFALYDETTGKRIRVYYDDELLDDVRACYRNFVRVTGDITFNEDGTKKSMLAHDIQIVHRDERVAFSDLFGILGDAE